MGSMMFKSMVQCVATAVLAIAASSAAFANQSVIVDCKQGGQPVVTSGLTSTTKVLQSFPSCTITVFTHGVTSPLPSIFSDNVGTVLANPFTAQNNPYLGSGLFYAANGRYDIQVSGGGLAAPLTFNDILLNDPVNSQTFGGNVSIAGTLGVSGATTLSSTLGVSGLGTFSGGILSTTLTATGASTLAAITVVPQGTATAIVTGVDSNISQWCGSVWNGSAAVNDCWSFNVNDFSGAFSSGSNLLINHLLSGGAGRILLLSDFVVGNPRSATALLNSNSHTSDWQGAYWHTTAQTMLWETGNTVNADGVFPVTFRQNFIPIFSDACPGCAAEIAFGGAGTMGVSGNYSGAPKWLWPSLNGNAFQTGSFTHSNTAPRAWNFPDAAGGVILDSFGRFTAGTVTTPPLTWIGDTGVGWYHNAADDVRYADATNDVLRIDSTGLALGATLGLQWGSGGVTARDSAIWRTAAKTLTIGNTTPGDFSGTLKVAALNNGGALALPGTTGTLATINNAQTWSGNQTNMPLVTPSISSPTITSPVINTGIGQGSGHKHQRFGTTCTTGATGGNTCTTAYTWNVAFGDALYTLNITCENGVQNPALIFETKTNAGFTARVFQIATAGAGSSCGTVDAIADHD